MIKHNLKINLIKCVFGGKEGKFLRFLVKEKQVVVDSSNTKAILATP